MLFNILSQPIYMNTDPRLVDRYDTEANSWDQKLYRMGFHHIYENLCHNLKHQGLLEDIDDNAHILDIGIGTAMLTETLLRYTPGQPYVTGIDISKQMIQAASKRLSEIKVRHNLMQMDISTMPDDSSQYDFIMCSYVLEHLTDPAAYVARIRHMLVPGGKFLLLITRKGLWGEYLRRKWKISPVTSSDVQSWFDEAGLTDVTELSLKGTLWGRFAGIAVIGSRK